MNKRILAVLLVLAMTVMCVPFVASAAGETISFSALMADNYGSSMKINDQVVVDVFMTASADVVIDGFQTDILYDAEKFEFVSIDKQGFSYVEGTGTAGRVRIAYANAVSDTNPGTTISVGGTKIASITLKAIANGSANVAFDTTGTTTSVIFVGDMALTACTASSVALTVAEGPFALAISNVGFAEGKVSFDAANVAQTQAATIVIATYVGAQMTDVALVPDVSFAGGSDAPYEYDYAAPTAAATIKVFAIDGAATLVPVSNAATYAFVID